MIATMIIMDLDNRVHPGGPEANTAQLRYITRMDIEIEDNYGISQGGLNLQVVKRVVDRLTSAKHISFSHSKSWTLAKGYTSYSLEVRYTNSDFWRVFNFQFIEGNGYTQTETENSQKRAVISERLRDILFPGKKSVVGKTAEINGKLCTITGVVENVSATCQQSYAEAWLPYTLSNTEAKADNLTEVGDHGIAILKEKNTKDKVLQHQLDKVLAEINRETGDSQILLSPVQDSWDVYFLGYQAIKSYEGTLQNLLSLFSRIILIMLIPAINLISLNITRMQERSEEIAIRKTYGASNSRLIGQLLTEQGALTLLAGVTGFILAIVAFAAYKHKILLSAFESTDSQLFINITFLPFAGCLLIVFLLNLMGGLIPAMKISKLQPARVLKGDLS
jgi:putative ABC transport system permease protein